MKKLCNIVVTIFCVLIVWGFLSPCAAEEVKRMTKEELKGMLGDRSVVLVDVRTEGDWMGSEYKIKGSVREDPARAPSWMGKYAKDTTLVFYCA